MAEALTDDLVEEILLRLAPDDPVSLVRAAAVCMRWRRVASTRSFRRGFARRHRKAPMLGFIANLRDGHEGDRYDYVARFVRATRFRPFCPERRHRRALDARHGRVLLTTVPWKPTLEVWDPVTGELRELPSMPQTVTSWNAAVVCAAHGACDHLDCRRGPFLVVLLDSGPEMMHLFVYSSETGAWSEPIFGPPSPTYGVEMVPTALVGNALYFLIDATESILKYDLAARSVSVIFMPTGFTSDFAALTTTEDGVLGFAKLEKSTVEDGGLLGSSRVKCELRLLSMHPGPDGYVTWAENGSIELGSLLNVDASIESDYVAFAHGVGIFFVGTEDAWFSIDLKSGRVMEEDYGNGDTQSIVPYSSFYTPGSFS
ncbi:hypothetical protein HU200_016410 [Digitaria exilis]|uniref:F-box domain-containing protein n=1 Tax=Digitaria exilis TaxID=1010633 RepID=A0A835KIM3_9POAL|nr:hypothetical protein HU200_016410 [Digitaria exilis]